MPHKPTVLIVLFVFACMGALAAFQTPPTAAPGQQRPAQQSEIELSITGEPGAPPKYAVPDFIALSPDADTVGGGQDDCGRALGRSRRSSGSST